MAYTDLQKLKRYLDIEEETDDQLLSEQIGRAQSVIEGITKRVFEVEADTTRYFTVGVDTMGRDLYLDEDLCQITSIKTDADADSPVTLTTSEYITYPRNETPYCKITILRSSENSWTYTDDPENGIEITGRWGWSVTPDPNIVKACNRLAAYFYSQKDAPTYDVQVIPEAGSIIKPKGIPEDVWIILKPYIKSV